MSARADELRGIDRGWTEVVVTWCPGCERSTTRQRTVAGKPPPRRLADRTRTHIQPHLICPPRPPAVTR